MPTTRASSHPQRTTKADVSTATPETDTPNWTEVFEELRRLRAAMCAYRRLVNRLLDERAY
jgi:hypothetical protein